MDIRSLKKITAKKGHLCNFSGRQIFPGEQYWCLSYVDDFNYEGKQHQTYRVSELEFEQFVKEKLFMADSCDYECMEREVISSKQANFKPQLTALFGDIPNFLQKKDRIYRNLKAGRKLQK